MGDEMLFFYPMWNHESQRIGKQKCTPLGYRLHVLAELLGFLGLLLLLGLCVYLAYKGIFQTFHASLCWLLAVPFGLGLIGRMLYQLSWAMAFRRGFEYDDDTSQASWMENGERVTYKWQAEDDLSE